MKFILILSMLLLTACSTANFFYPFTQQEQQFQCDMDPHRTRCGTFQELHGLNH